MAKNTTRFHLFGTAACYLPAGVCLAVGNDTPLGWWIAWWGSVFIFLMVWSGRVFTLGDDRPRSAQPLRPWFIMHLVYGGYTFLSSIFYWMDLRGWYFLNPHGNPPANAEDLGLAAQVQFYYVLAHAALVTGFGLARAPKPEGATPWRWSARMSLPEALLKISAGATVLAICFRFVPGMDQFAEKSQGLAMVGAAMSLGLAKQDKAAEWVPMAFGLNCILLLSALASGWKEATLVLVLLNALAFYPVAPRRTVILTGLAFVLSFSVLPSISNTLRRETWNSDNTKGGALTMAFNELSSKSSRELGEEIWAFLTNRLSEQALFTRYVASTPEHVPFHGWDIAQQAVMSLVPRIAWPGKPNLEILVMGRVYENGAVSSDSSVSAKPQYVVDGYLSGGALGVLLSGVFLGWMAQSCSRWCEEKFGGYLIGGIVFNGLFASLWRANCWEFLLNPVMWSLVLGLILHVIGRANGWISPVEPNLPAITRALSVRSLP